MSETLILTKLAKCEKGKIGNRKKKREIVEMIEQNMYHNLAMEF